MLHFSVESETTSHVYLKTLSKDQLRYIFEVFYNITNGIISISTKDKMKISKYNSICVEGVGIRASVVEGVWSTTLVAHGSVGIIASVVAKVEVSLSGVDKLNSPIIFKNCL